MDKHKEITFCQKMILIMLGIFTFFVLLEIGLHLEGLVFLSLQEYRNRIAIYKKGTYRIMCLGESTTAIGGRDSYPSQLEDILNQRNIGIKFSVINKGIPATNSETILLQLEDNLNKYNPNMVITMMGVADVWNIIPYKENLIDKHLGFLTKLRIYKLYKLLIVMRNYEKTEELYKKIGLVVEPKNSRVYAGAGWFYKDQGMLKEAEEMFKKAIEIDPKNSRAYAGLVWCYRDQKRFKEAEEMFKKAIEIDPKNSRAYAGLVWCYREQGRFKEAEEMFKKAIEADPKEKLAYIGLGWCYQDQGMLKEAEEMFKKAIEADPKVDLWYGGLAVCYEKQGKYDSAEEYFNKANRLRLENLNQTTCYNYQRLKKIVLKRGIKLVCVQYPMRSIEPLKKMFDRKQDVIFVDNEMVFKKAVRESGYDAYFVDNVGGDFGHCTRKGNRLLAENIANVILKEYFNR